VTIQLEKHLSKFDFDESYTAYDKFQAAFSTPDKPACIIIQMQWLILQ